MKTLSVYRTDKGIIVERKNEFGTGFQKGFETVEGMLEYLDTYKQTGTIDEYELKVSDEFWPTVINFINTDEMPRTSKNNDLLVLHKKMYDVRWNADEGDPEQLEKEFISLANLENVDLEKVNEMLNQLYIPPYQNELLPEHLKSKHGGKREGAGRPSLGVTKKVSITLPKEIWDAVGTLRETRGWSTQSEALREIIQEYITKD